MRRKPGDSARNKPEEAARSRRRSPLSRLKRIFYARTLRHWYHNLQRYRGELVQLGYDDAFFRLWEFYLCYCEGGFRERGIGTAQILLGKPDARPGDTILGE